MTEERRHTPPPSKLTVNRHSVIPDYKTVFFNSSEGILVTDSNRKIIAANPSFTRITGYQEQDVLGKTPSFLKSQRHDQQFFDGVETVLSKYEKWQGEIWNRRKNGEIHPQWLSIIPVVNNGRTEQFIGIFTDISGFLSNNAVMRSHAYSDSLTGLPNRMLLYDRLTFMLNLARRRNGIMCVLYLDINRFKMINDTLGYSLGDQLLQNVAARLKSSTREVDSVFRLGDDEFAILLEDIDKPQDASRVAKRILSACAKPFVMKEQEMYVTVSIGVSLYPNDGEHFEQLLKNAETAMLRAKELGISNYQHYKPSMNTQAYESLTLEYNLQKALKNNQFRVYYQPIIQLNTNEIIGAEALIRWGHPELGIITPAQFVPLAEETGLILPIGEWVLETACETMQQWNMKTGRSLFVSVNLSARQFQQPELVANITRVLERSGLSPSQLKLEITESIGMKNPVQTLNTLRELKELGILFAIDDFGTGYSSLSYLKQFPIDTIKIDKSFVMEMEAYTNDSAIVDAVIALAHSLNVDVIAEGVETADQVNYLRSKSCDKVQGFYYSRPVSTDDFYQLLADTPWITT